MKKTFLLVVVLLLSSSLFIQAQSKSKAKAKPAGDQSLQELKTELQNQKSDLDKLKSQLQAQQSELDNLKKSYKKIYTKSIVVYSYYDGQGNRLNPSSSGDADVKVDFPDNFFTQKPEVILAVRGWSYTGKIATDNSLKWEGQTLKEYWPLGPNWVKTAEVNKNYCKVRAFLYEKENMTDNGFIVDVIAIGE